MKLSQHSKIRIKQRTQLNHQERRTLFRDALKNGKSPGEINDDRLKNYLLSKETYRSKVKLYKGYVFIHSRNSKQLYTMYELPKKYKVIDMGVKNGYKR